MMKILVLFVACVSVTYAGYYRGLGYGYPNLGYRVLGSNLNGRGYGGYYGSSNLGSNSNGRGYGGYYGASNLGSNLYGYGAYNGYSDLGYGGLGSYFNGRGYNGYYGNSDLGYQGLGPYSNGYSRYYGDYNRGDYPSYSYDSDYNIHN